ncbi:MAG: transcriptional activator NhaR [Gemmatimonadetes bacterium]|nr:transcriptional activator NhaR [Gemmatimonadota bacterium]
MAWLNYHHLYYFWTVAREGSIARATQKLHLTQPTISAQIKALEESLGEPLFSRTGRKLVLTDVGQVAYRYAEEIFSLGRELQDVLAGQPTGRPVRFNVGIADQVPKLLAHRLLAPVLSLPEPVHLSCREDRPARLFAELSTHALDLVLTDAPITSEAKVRAFNHPLGETGVSVFGTAPLAEKYRRGFPGSLTGAPFLLPTEGTSLRRSLEEWFERARIRPAVIGEFSDSALLKVFGMGGVGLFAAPTAIAADIRRQYEVRVVGELEGVREAFYAVTVERRLRHPAVVSISEAARHRLFT